MKLLFKTLTFAPFFLLSWFVYGSFNPIDTIQNGNPNHGSIQQEALFHPTILFFQTGSDMMDAQALSSIEKMVTETKNKSTVTFIISGFTDPIGSGAFNQKLSKKRAESVKKELLKRGFTESQFILKTFGESQSVNTPLHYYYKMRKVEIKMVVLMK
jgi:outer membrane protein OmpA-like peptidoglycan-associated protein